MPIGSFEDRPFAAFRLTERFRRVLRSHFAELSANDLYLRFGIYCRPEILDAYVDGISFHESIVVGVFADDRKLAGVAHLGPQDEQWELGLSVLEGWRNRGIGTLLLRRAAELARRLSVERIFINGLAENRALIHMVRKMGAHVSLAAGEAHCAIALRPESPARLARRAAGLSAALTCGRRRSRSA